MTMFQDGRKITDMRVPAHIIVTGLLAVLPALAFAREVVSDRYYADDNFLMYELPTRPDVVAIIGKIRTQVVSVYDNTTTSGLPVKSWVLQTVWDRETSPSSSADKAIEKNPAWKSFGMMPYQPPSRHCRLKNDSPDIKVEKGLREYRLDANSLICAVVLHTRGEASLKMQEWVDRGEIIDSGVEPIVVHSSAPGTRFSTKDLRDTIASFLPENASISPGLAGFLLAHAVYGAASRSNGPNPIETFLTRSNDLEADLDRVNRVLFAEGADGLYSLKPVAASDQVSLSSMTSFTFDPQEQQK